MQVLLTGGAGYIGSHTCVELLNNGYEVVIADNFDNSSEKVLSRIKEITGKDVTVFKIDVADKDALRDLFSKCDIDSVIRIDFNCFGVERFKPFNRSALRCSCCSQIILCFIRKKRKIKSLGIFGKIEINLSAEKGLNMHLVIDCGGFL